MNTCHQQEIAVAIRDCLNTAKAKFYRDIGDVADTMGVNREVLYKWVQTGRIPAVHIAYFEQACGDAALTRALAAAQRFLLVPEAAQVPLQVDLATVHCQIASAILAAATAQVDVAQTGQAVRSITQAINSLAALRQCYAKVTT